MTADRLSHHKRAVVLCCDADYFPYTAYVAKQIVDRHPHRAFDVCICSNDALQLPDSLRDLAVRLCRFETGRIFDSLGTAGHVTVTSYLRLALPEAFIGDYNRLLYLDGDVTIFSDCIDQLMDCDFLGHPAAAVRDNIQWRRPNRMPREFRLFGLQQAPYFNAGVMVMDLVEWERQEITPRALALGSRFAGRLHYADQSLLNGVLHRNWAEISPVWNWQRTSKTAFFGAMCDVQIMHFIGPRKPWNDTTGFIVPAFVRPVGAFLANHFPQVAQPPSTSSVAIDAKRTRRVLWDHVLAAGPMARYLSRFPELLTVIK